MIEIEVARGDEADRFLRAGAREALAASFGFTVVWHEQFHEFCAKEGETILGALRCRIAASLAVVEALTVAPAQRGRGVGRALLQRCEETANYYNCHKVSVQITADSPAKGFFLRCGYHVEATLPQHTFKKDVDFLRKFLL